MMPMIIILNIGRMIASQSKYDSQKLPANGNHSLNFRHAPVDHSKVIFMHYSIGSDGVDSNKKQHLAKVGAPPLGDMALSLVFTGTDEGVR
jgi:hypothetical protein